MGLFKQKVLWLAGLFVCFGFIYLAREALVVLFGAFIFASALLPAVETLDRRLPRWLAVLIPFALFSLVAFLVVIPTFGLGVEQLKQFGQDIPVYQKQLHQWTVEWASLGRRYSFLSGIMPERLLQHTSLENPIVFSGFTGITLILSKAAMNVLAAVVISFFLLLERESLQTYLLRFFTAAQRERISIIIDKMTRSTGGFVSGQFAYMAVVGALTGIGLYLIGFPFYLLVGILTGLLSIIPVLGPNIVLIPAMVIALFSPSGPMGMLWVLGVYVVVQLIANNAIGPLIMGRAVGLPPLAIIVALLIGGTMFGLVGVILAIPVATCLNIILEEWVMDPEQRLNRLIQQETPAQGIIETP